MSPLSPNQVRFFLVHRWPAVIVEISASDPAAAMHLARAWLTTCNAERRLMRSVSRRQAVQQNCKAVQAPGEPKPPYDTQRSAGVIPA
jgi:hypothetical protein